MEKGEKTIPADILMDFFKGLPYKNLMRLRCVSKTWNLTICDPIFIRMHRTSSQTHHRAATSIQMSCIGQGRNLYFHKINGEREATHELTVDITKFGFNDGCKVTEIVNGLVCFCKYGDVIVCNITTHEVILLPPHPLAASDFRSTVSFPIYSLGYDPLKNEYKVLSIWYRSGFCKCTVFTVGKSKEWREVIDPLDCALHPKSCSKPIKFCDAMYRDVVYHDGVLHWLSSQPYRGQKQGLVLFDVREEKFRVLRVPIVPRLVFILSKEGRIVVRDDKSSIEDYKKEVWIRKKKNSMQLLPSSARYAYRFRAREIALDPNKGEISRTSISTNPKFGYISRPVESVCMESTASVDDLAEFYFCEIIEDIYPIRGSKWTTDVL